MPSRRPDRKKPRRASAPPAAQPPTRASVPAPTAPHAEARDAPAHLTHAQRATLDEALRRGTDLADEMKSLVSAYGRWLLAEVFGGDSTAALDERNEHPVWLELVRRAGGPTLPLSRRMLYVAVQVAAYDKRITAPSWRALDSGRKEILLPLRDEARLRDAAERVTKFNLSQTKTWAYVTQLLAERGRTRQARWGWQQFNAKIKGLRAQLAGAAVLRRVRELRDEADDEARQRTLEEVDALRETLAALRKTIAG